MQSAQAAERAFQETLTGRDETAQRNGRHTARERGRAPLSPYIATTSLKIRGCYC